MINKREIAYLKKHKRELIEETRKISFQLRTTISTVLALVAALFWQTAITDTIKAFIDVNGAWIYELLVALVITIGATIAIYYLTKNAE